MKKALCSILAIEGSHFSAVPCTMVFYVDNVALETR